MCHGYSQTKTMQSFIKDGQPVEYYSYNGINISLALSEQRQYGKYYVAYITIENLTGHPFNFFTSTIQATYTRKNKETNGIVLTNAEYMKIVNRRQAWNTAINTYNENSAARGAGYSYSNSNSRISAYNQTATINSNSRTYNAANGYIAQQNAQNNINNFQNEQQQIKSVLNQGYLKDNTIDNQQKIIGYVNIKFEKSDKITINVPVNGEVFSFYWGAIK